MKKAFMHGKKCYGLLVEDAPSRVPSDRIVVYWVGELRPSTIIHSSIVDCVIGETIVLTDGGIMPAKRCHLSHEAAEEEAERLLQPPEEPKR